jgi:hypothetical protein
MDQTRLSLNAALRRHNRDPSSEKLKFTTSIIDIIEGHGADYCFVSLSMVSLTTWTQSSTGHHLPFKIVSNTPSISFGTTFLQNAVQSRTTSNATTQPTYHHPSYIALLRNAIRRRFNRAIMIEYPLVQEECGAELKQISAGIKCPINPPLWFLNY